MVSLVDVKNDVGNLAQLEADLRDASTAKPAEEQKPGGDKETQQNNSDDGLPDKFKGKSPQEIAQMYQDLHSAYGRMANDLGTQRKLTDRLLDLKRSDDLVSNDPARKKVTVSASELLEKPTEALDTYFDSAFQAREQATLQRVAQLEASLAQQTFMAKHSDYQSIAESSEFQAYLQKSPYRSRLAQQAYSGDWGAADELLSDWKAMRPAAASSATQQKADTEGARKASLEGGSGNDAAAPTGKVYRRADLIRLKMEKPQVYEDPGFQAEILLAYAQGRVK